MADETGFQPDWATSPAETIHSARIVDFADLAHAMGSKRTLLLPWRKVTSKSTKETLGLAAAFNTSANFWQERQKQYSHDTDRLKQASIEKAWLRELPLRDMLKFGWIKAYQNDAQKISAVLQFFGVSDLSEWKSRYRTDLAAAAFRTSLTFTSNPVSTAAWLRWADSQASEISVQSLGCRSI